MYANLAYIPGMPRTAAKSAARVHLRLDATAKRKLERAAAYADTTISAFVLRHALDAAERELEAREHIKLAPLDWDAFMAALDNPPEPTPALREAIRRHRRSVR